MLNFSGDQFAAAGFTFLLFDVVQIKVSWIYPSKGPTHTLVCVVQEGDDLDGFSKTALSINSQTGRKSLVGPNNTLFLR